MTTGVSSNNIALTWMLDVLHGSQACSPILSDNQQWVQDLVCIGAIFFVRDLQTQHLVCVSVGVEG